MRLVEYGRMKATLHLKSGLYVGTGEKVGRGEPLPVIKSQRTDLPYMPGSSIKGKIRHLLEISYGRKETNPRDPGSPCWCGKCQICLLFGSGNSRTTFEPSRLIFRDCFLSDDSVTLIEKKGLENKPGVRIDRNSGKAAEGALFPMERIPEGCEFKLEISARVFEDDDKKALRKWLVVGLFLMEQDALGGGGTRGSGWVEVKDVNFNDEDLDNWREEAKQDKDKLLNVSLKK